MPTPELPSVDVDLQDLYEQVLAGFDDDSFPELPTPVAQNKASPSDLESLYSSYAEDSTDPSSKLARNTSYTIASQRTQTSTPVSFRFSHLIRFIIFCYNQPFPLNDPHRFNPRDKLQDDDSLLSPEIPLHPQHPVCMGCQSPARMSLPAVKNRELFYSACSFLPDRLSITINPLSPRHSIKAYNGANGYFNGVGSTKDSFPSDPRFSHQSHLSSTLHSGSPRSTASPSIPHSPAYPPDDADLIYGWRERTSSSGVGSARPPLPPKIPSQPAQISQMPEPSMPTEDLYSPYSDAGGSNGAGAPVYRTDSASSYVLPPLPHQTYQPGQRMNPHTESPSCKKLVSSETASFDRLMIGYADVENMTLSRGPSASTSGYSHVNVDRNNSITSNNTGGEPIIIGPSSSVVTSLYRDDSTVSRVSSLPQEYMDIKMPVPLEEEYPQEHYPEEYPEDGEPYTDSEEDESLFVNFALLSHLAVRLRDRVPRGTHVKGSIPYPRAFTGKDIVVSVVD